ncbi:MAG: TIGR00730 family Rossman fold protein, partial [Elusimicrobiota bacterium]
ARAARKRLDAARAAVTASKYYGIARRLGAIVAENGGGEVAIVTGGGPGIMEAANRGAFEAGGPSVGYNIKLDKEQGLNPYVTAGLDFEFQNFSTRKMALRHGAMALVYFPGGFGTMDELFEVLTMMQNRKMARAPIVLVGEKDYWDKIIDFGELARMGLVSPGDLSLFRFADTAESAWRAIQENRK